MSKLLGLLIFDHLNDIVYIKCNKKFIQHVQKLAISEGLVTEPTESQKKEDCYAEEGTASDEGKSLEEERDSEYSQKYLDKNVIIQLFSPLVASHRIMKSQFKNAYDSISCEDGTRLIFREHSSHLFLCIGTYSESYLNRFTNVSIRMSQLILGLCISVLKTNQEKVRTLDCLLNAWIELYSSDQSFLVEAIERLIVNPDISSTAVYNLASIVDGLTEQKGVGSGHGLFFVKNKLLALYSSKNAEEILESDILSLNLLLKANTLRDDNSLYLNTVFCEGVSSPVLPEEGDFGETDDDDPEDKEEDPSGPAEGFDFSNTNISEYVLFLQTKSSPLAPHVVYLYSVTSELSLVVVTQVNRSLLSGQLVEMFRVLEDLKNEENTVKQIPLMEIIDNSLRNSQDFMKWIPKSSYSKIKKCLFQLCHKWEFMKKNDLEEWLRSSPESVLPSRLEASLNSFVSTLKTTWNVACLDVASPTVLKAVGISALEAKEKMSKFFASPEPEECIRNISLGARSIISMSKYLEEFPGLIHFLYIDRATHQLTAPPLWTEKTLQDTASSDDASESLRVVRDLTAAKIWAMVGFARDHLSRGHSSIIWKDKTFSYSYFLWFEDQGGNPLKQVALNKEVLKLLPQPGILCDDFYKAYAAKSFPNNSVSCIRGFELFCIHIGLATSPCILEQTRRLAATIWEIAGPSSINPIDLL